MNALTYGDKITVDFVALPEVSQYALAQRGLTHILGNEVASKVHSWAQGEGQAASDDKAVVKAWKDANPGAITEKTQALQAELVADLLAGELGLRVSGPRLTPVETIARQMARKEVEDILRANKIKVPKGEDKVKMGEDEFTLAELISRRLAKYGERIGKSAEAEAKRRAKATEAVTANAAEAVADL